MITLNVDERVEKWLEFKNSLAPQNRTKELFAVLDKIKSKGDSDLILDAVIIGIHLIVDYQRNFALNRRNAADLIRATTERMEYLCHIAPKKMHHLQATFYLTLAKVESNHGHFWNALTYSSFAFGINARVQPGGKVNGLIDQGSNHLRLGFGAAAKNSLRLAVEAGEGRQKQLAAFLLSKARRLCDLEDPSQLNSESETAQTSPSPEIQQEYIWENICKYTTISGRLNRVIAAAKKGGTHYESSYVLEAKLWTYSIPSSHNRKQLAKLSTLARDKNLQFATISPIYKNLLTLEEAYDSLRPLAARMEKMSQALERVSQLILIDHAQLFMIAACHWFKSEKLYTPALACILRYEQISLSLTDGRSKDHLGISKTLTKQKWFREHRPASVR